MSQSDGKGGQRTPIILDNHGAYPINTLTLGGRPDPENDARMTMGVGDDGDPQFTISANHSHAVCQTVPRRLTPTECERLQGFPDNWTQVEHNGKPMADGPRYRMMGNAVTVNVVEWIGRRIMEAELKREAA